MQSGRAISSCCSSFPTPVVGHDSIQHWLRSLKHISHGFEHGQTHNAEETHLRLQTRRWCYGMVHIRYSTCSDQPCPAALSLLSVSHAILNEQATRWTGQKDACANHKQTSHTCQYGKSSIHAAPLLMPSQRAYSIVKIK